MEIEKQIEELQKGFKSFQENHTKQLNEIKEKGYASKETEGKVNEMSENVLNLQKSVDELQKQINLDRATEKTLGAKASEKTDKYLGFIQPAIDGEDEKQFETNYLYKQLFFDGNNRWDETKEKAYRDAFLKHIRTGRVEYLHEFEGKMRSENIIGKSMNVINDAAGGFLLSPIMMSLIEHTLAEFSPFHQEVEVITMMGNEFDYPTTNARAGAARKHELGSVSETTAPTFGEVTIKPEELYAEPQVSYRMLALRPDVERFVAELIAKEFQITEASEMAIGTNSSQCRGMLTYDAGTAVGQIQQIASGNASTIDDLDPFIDMIAALKPGHRGNAKFHIPRLTQAIVMKLTDGQGRYMWQPSVQAGTPAVLFGYPVLDSEDVPAVGTDALSVLFGDLRKAYKLHVWPGVRMLRDPYTNKPFIKMHSTRVSGGAVVVHEALKIMKCATSV